MATPLAESGVVYVRKSMADRMYNDSKQGILHFPNGQFKDFADVLAQALQHHTQNSKITIRRIEVPDNDDTSTEESPLDWI